LDRGEHCVIGDVPAPIDILLIEDDPGDVLLTREAFARPQGA